MELYIPGNRISIRPGCLVVRFKQVYDNRYFPYTGGQSAGSIIPFGTRNYLSFDIEFVKMGTITAGTLNTTAFPRVEVNVSDDVSSTRVAWHSITGSATLQAPSCTTPDFNWSLGRVTTQDLRNTGDAGSWVDTPVRLTGCSTFNGNNSNGSYTQYTISGYNTGNTEQSGSSSPNTLTMTLTPNTSVLDSANGIVSLDSTATASGVAVQLASKQSGSYVAQNLANTMVVNPTVGDSSGIVTFPLAARIISTSSTVAAGTVVTSVTYNITYQ